MWTADASSSSPEPPMEPRAYVELGSGKHTVFAHFPKDPNCEICLKSKMTRSSCRRRANAVMPRADNFSDLVTADHKVVSEESESRNKHRYAVEAQDLATQWIQSYPFQTKTSQETSKSLRKFLEPTVFSQARTCNACLFVAQELQRDHGAHGNSSVIWSVISLLVSSTSSQFQCTTTRSTTWTARPSPRRHCTPSTSSRTFTVDKQP